ncbi:MAG TPA: type I-E CRISPR-associated protein Cse1/CasA [Dehalococcoidia bacterium]|nr:type I-E CRISPR-associated protein Cse1/CasA [Dehalococcoidia bacterium]
MPGFNLLEEPWVPVLLPDGAPAELPLGETLLRAHELSEVSDESPLVTASLHRLLLALLHAVFRGPASPSAWAALWSAGRFDPATLGRYFAQWRPRFELFDAERPFYQRTDMETVTNASSALRLVHDRAAANSNRFWDKTDDDAGLTPAAAARALITTQGYAFAGGVSFPLRFYDAPNMRGYTALVRGETLFQTLALNLVVYNAQEPFARTGADLPAWEQETFAVPDKDGTKPAGYLDLLTFQARAVRLLRDEDGQVRRCLFRMNIVLDDRQALDPFKSYRHDEKLGWRPRTLTQGRAVWRDSHALFAASEAGRRPRVLDYVAQIPQALDDEGWKGALPPQQPNLDVLGLCSEPGKAIVHYWRQERLPMPLAYLDDRALQDRLQQALQAAENGYSALASAVYTLARLILQPDGRKGDEKAIRALADSMGADVRYWRALDLAFDGFLPALADDWQPVGPAKTYGAHALPAWGKEIQRAAQTSFRAAADMQGESARALRAAAEAEQGLRMRLSDPLRQRPRGGEPAKQTEPASAGRALGDKGGAA